MFSKSIQRKLKAIKRKKEMARTTVKIEIPEPPSDEESPIEIPLVNRPRSLPAEPNTENFDRGNKVGFRVQQSKIMQP